MTQIGHIVIGLIIVVAAIYLIIFVSQRLTARKVNKLIQKKAQLAEIPMRDRLVKGRQLSLTGQSLKQFQLLEAKYNHLETNEFNNIDLKANTVLFDSQGDRKSTRLNSSHVSISYAVFCLKKKS